jgi:hypothetical protein
MSKKSITWIELLKEKISLKGKGTSIGDVAPEAKKEWQQIKEGKHSKYVQGKMVKSSRKKHKSEKKHKGSNKNHNSMISQLLGSKKICSNCTKEIKYIMNKSQSGGSSCGKTTDELAQSGGGCGCGGTPMSGGECSSCGKMSSNDMQNDMQNGGKKSKRSSKKFKKNKKGHNTRKSKKHGGSYDQEDPVESDVNVDVEHHD